MTFKVLSLSHNSFAGLFTRWIYKRNQSGQILDWRFTNKSFFQENLISTQASSTVWKQIETAPPVTGVAAFI